MKQFDSEDEKILARLLVEENHLVDKIAALTIEAEKTRTAIEYLLKLKNKK
jgi:hypothetical protein